MRLKLKKWKIQSAWILMGSVLISIVGHGQAVTYSIDQGFSSGELFRAAVGVTDFHYFDNGRILVGGRYIAEEVEGIARIFSNGAWDSSFPYAPIQCDEIIPQEDGFVFPAVQGFDKLLWNGIP